MIRLLLTRVRRTLASQRGDSMVEVLSAILIATLGATLLATMVMAAVSTTSRSEQALDDAYRAEAALFDHVENGKAVTVELPDGAGTVDIGVKVYGSDGYAYYQEGGKG